MDLTQSMRQLPLQNMQRGGAAQPMLSQMELQMLQSGYLGRSPSAMDMQSNALSQLSTGSLVGTVAALQEESGQLRSQWKYDVTRLEQELSQLRAAAFMALPHLADAQKQPGLRMLCMEPNLQALATLPGRSNLSHLQQALLLQGAAADRSLPLIKGLSDSSATTTAPLYTSRSEMTEVSIPSDRDQLLNRIAELERQQISLEQERDQALRTAPRGMPAIPERRREESAEKPHEHSAMLLTEALLCQMRMSSSAESSGKPSCRDIEAPPAVPRRFEDLVGSIPAGPSAAVVPQPHLGPPGSSNTQEEIDRLETQLAEAQIYQELERMDIELQKVRDENRRLKDEKEACEAAHSRDVSTLEAMVTQGMDENTRLNKALSEAMTLLTPVKKMDPIEELQDKITQAKKFEGAPLTPHSIRSESEPANEPDIDRTIEFDRSKLNISVGAQYAQLA